MLRDQFFDFEILPPCGGTNFLISGFWPPGRGGFFVTKGPKKLLFSQRSQVGMLRRRAADWERGSGARIGVKSASYRACCSA